ncbi:cell division protein FtsQ/DivIB [Paenibacillus tarimensis]|uniref:cell division protein FtsQ/DivIB n=1 Tax=Paenibacillus tarimensis TaxID=416012 RepID=UPI001F2F3E68|nr:FtsQ-type POTRA domain-containing protein [Paenibacillus tarimensis]
MPDQMPVLREPKPARRANRKLLAIILLLFVVLLSILFFRSSISKISSVTVTGHQHISASEIQEAADIAVGDPFFYPSESEFAKRIKQLNSVEEVEVTKSFPGAVHITVKEYPTVAFELSDKGEISAILSNGTVLPAGSNYVVDKPVLSGWPADDPVREELTAVLADIPPDLLADFSQIMPFPSNSYADRIRIYTRTKFEIITAVSLLPEKVETIKAVIETQDPGSVTLLLSDRYVPYISEAEGEQEQ